MSKFKVLIKNIYLCQVERIRADEPLSGRWFLTDTLIVSSSCKLRYVINIIIYAVFVQKPNIFFLLSMFCCVCFIINLFLSTVLVFTMTRRVFPTRMVRKNTSEFGTTSNGTFRLWLSTDNGMQSALRVYLACLFDFCAEH